MALNEFIYRHCGRWWKWLKSLGVLVQDSFSYWYLQFSFWYVLNVSIFGFNIFSLIYYIFLTWFFPLPWFGYRNDDAMKRFSEKGILTKNSPLEVAEASDAVITMLPSSSHVSFKVVLLSDLQWSTVVEACGYCLKIYRLPRRNIFESISQT